MLMKVLVSERAEAKGTRNAHKLAETMDNTDKMNSCRCLCDGCHCVSSQLEALQSSK